MMTKETLTAEQVVENINEFIKVWNEERDDEVDEVQPPKVTYELIKEMNADITGSQQSNVPEVIWDVLADEEVVPDDEEMQGRFVEWYEEKHS